MNKFKMLLAIVVSVFVFVVQKRLGMAVIAFMVTNLLLTEKLGFNVKTILYIITAIILYYFGRKLSLSIALLCAAPMGIFAWTLTGGFVGGIIELEIFLFVSLFLLKLIICKNVTLSLKYIARPAIICFLIGGFIQGSYITGWQNLCYI